MTYSAGLICCDIEQEWKTLNYEIRGARWLWRCSICKKVIRIDPYNPPLLGVVEEEPCE